MIFTFLGEYLVFDLCCAQREFLVIDADSQMLAHCPETYLVIKRETL